MVYRPGSPGWGLEASPDEIVLAYEEVYIETSDGENLHGWYVSSQKPRGTLLFFHGNAGNISHRLESIEIFSRLGLDVLIIDYRGYGMSSGRTTEPGTYLDADAAWYYLTVDRGIPADKIILFGRSLGGAVAAWLASQHEPAGLILESTFSSGKDMAKRYLPIYPPGLMTRFNYPVKEVAARIQIPSLVVHSRDDEITPYWMGRLVFGEIAAEKTFVELHGDHDSAFWVAREDYIPAVAKFVNSVVPASKQE